MTALLRSVARRIVRRRSNRLPRAALGERFTVGERTQLVNAVFDVRDPASSSLHVGSDTNLAATMVLECSGAAIRVGERTHIGARSLLDAAVSIVVGDDVLISFDVLVFDHDSHALAFSDRRHDVVEWNHGRKDWSRVPTAPVVISNKCWVGARAIILKGVTLGEGAVVGAGSVVTRDVAPWTLVAGNPARVIRTLEPSP